MRGVTGPRTGMYCAGLLPEQFLVGHWLLLCVATAVFETFKEKVSQGCLSCLLSVFGSVLQLSIWACPLSANLRMQGVRG